MYKPPKREVAGFCTLKGLLRCPKLHADRRTSQPPHTRARKSIPKHLNFIPALVRDEARRPTASASRASKEREKFCASDDVRPTVFYKSPRHVWHASPKVLRRTPRERRVSLEE